MTTTVVYGDTSDGMVLSSATVSQYSAARAGQDMQVNTNRDTISVDYIGAHGVGQMGFTVFDTVFSCAEGFIRFEIGDLDGDVVTDADLVLYQTGGTISIAFNVEARAYDWGTTLTTGDWVSGASLGALPLLATWAASISGVPASRTFTPNGSALVDHLNGAGGSSRILLNSSRHRTGDAPGQSSGEHAVFASADAAGTTNDPRLVIDHEPSTPDLPLERFNGTAWEAFAFQRYSGTAWEALTIEVAE